MRVDDVVAGLAEDAIKPVRIGKHVRLMSADSVALYEELTGRHLEYDTGQPNARPLAPSARLDCDRPAQPEMAMPNEPASPQAPKLCVRCARSPRLPGGALCDRCDGQVEQLVLALRAKREIIL